MARGGPGTWSVRSPSIVGVFSVRDGVQPVTVSDPVLDAAEEFVLAVEAPIRTVRLILRAITLVCADLDQPYADLACDGVSSAPLLGREAGGYPQQGDDLVGADGPGG